VSLTVSVALCTNNGERFLREQLESIMAQSQQPDELVISDDASSDGTLALASAVIDEVRTADPALTMRVRIVSNPVALGVTANFERAIGECSSDLIALCDQDDIWEPDRVAKATAEFEARPDLVLLHSNATLVDAAGASVGETLFEAQGISASVQQEVHAGQAFEVLLRRNIVTGATTMFRRTLADAAAPFPTSWLHDEWLAIIASGSGEVDLVPEELVHYRQHGSNQVGAGRLSFRAKVHRLLEDGTTRNSRLLARAGALAERLPGIPGVSPARVGLVENKLAHERVRSSLSAHRPLRVATVVRELRTGRYREFGMGSIDALRDLMQPLRRAG
jgi:glycosyltransferase involved in cell wall biosynthesis